MPRMSRKPATGLRTSVRLSLQFSFLYSILSALVFAMAYWFTQYEVRDWVQDQMRGDAQSLRAIYDDGGVGKLVNRLDALAEVSFENARIYQLQDGSGTILSGNIVQPMGVQLPATIPAAQLRLNRPFHAEVERYWMQETTIGPYRLIQGSGNHIIAEILEALGAALVLGYLVVISLGLVVGVRVGRITEQRITSILNTLARVSSGELEARVPLNSRTGGDLSRVADRINAMLDQITRLIESQQQISNDIAHDMRTPLQRLHQRLERMIDAEVVTRDAVQASLEQTRELIATFNALLRIAQLEGDDNRARFQQIDLAPVLSNIVELFGPLAEDEGIEMSLRLPTEPLNVLGDRGLLTQLFSNIVENAIKHCPSGTIIDVTADLAEQDLIVRLADDGPGIEPENRERIFLRFFRAERSRHRPGNGLGLSLVKAIADMHSATISVSDNKPGTVFEVRLAHLGGTSFR